MNMEKEITEENLEAYDRLLTEDNDISHARVLDIGEYEYWSKECRIDGTTRKYSLTFEDIKEKFYQKSYSFVKKQKEIENTDYEVIN